MRSVRVWWPFGLVALAVLAWNYPVYAVTAYVESASAGRVQVLNSSGSLWSGQVQLGLSDGSQVYAIPEAVRWKLGFGGADHWAFIQIEHPKLVQSVHLGFTGTSISASGGEIRLPASWLVALGAPFNTIRPEGLLQLSWAGWQSGQAVSASLEWQDAQSALASVRPLGQYVMQISGTPGVDMQMTLTTVRGPLVMEGQGRLVKGQRFEFKGQAYSEERSREALKGLLSQMGRQEGDRYRLGVF